MTTVKEIYNLVFGANAMGNSTLYFEKGNKVVRFADHVARAVNFEIYNEYATDIYLVYINSGLTEREIQANVLEVETLTKANVDYNFFEEGDDLEIMKMQIERFLN